MEIHQSEEEKAEAIAKNELFEHMLNEPSDHRTLGMVF